jgi:hypothetical protein
MAHGSLRFALHGLRKVSFRPIPVSCSDTQVGWNVLFVLSAGFAQPA